MNEDSCIKSLAVSVTLIYTGKAGEAMGNLRNAKCESAKGYFAKRRAKRSVIGQSGNAYFADYPSLLW